MGKDAREAVVRERLSTIERVLVFASPKGGVGKTTISCSFALFARLKGYRIGLLDLDLTNPTAHVILGIDLGSVKIEEEKGVKPLVVKGMEFFSPALFVGDEPLPLRGAEIHDAILEVLAIVRWSPLHILVVDSPPGLSDEFMDVVKYFPEPLTVAISTPSPLSEVSTKRFIKYLRDEGVKLLGLLENMGEGSLERLARDLGVDYLGSIPYDPELDESVRRGSLETTKFFAYASKVFENILLRLGLQS